MSSDICSGLGAKRLRQDGSADGPAKMSSDICSGLGAKRIRQDEPFPADVRCRIPERMT